jgi:Stage II sporulation protein E (SpoIIE)
VSVVPTPVRILIGALLALALLLGLRSRFSAVRARRLEGQRRQLLEDVGLLQGALLPIPPASIGPVGTYAAYRPADGFAAGGDFYDVFALEDGQVGVIVGDVSGHGRDALPHTALVRFTLKAYLEAGMSPRIAIKTAGTVLERQLGGSFATVVAATYNPRERQLVYAGAGHPPPIVLGSRSRSISPITVSSSPPVGAGMRTGSRQTVVSVPGRGTVCFYTDGVTEARVGSDLFGPERLRETVASLQVGDSAAVLLDRVAEQTDARPDDMAACVLYLDGGAARPKVLLEELELNADDALSDPVRRFLLECGLQPDKIAEITHQAGVAAGQTGTALLQVRFGEGRPDATLHRENLALLRPRRAPREALVGAAR